jgi:peptide/nickel transport system substrate-binding protein
MKRQTILSALVLLATVFAACAPAVPEVQEVPVTVVVPGTPEVITEVVTATPAPEPVPAVGGTLVIASREEPDTLDLQQSALNVTRGIGNLIGATLVTKDPQTNATIPYLAKSWSVAPDGLTWEFELRQDVKFHDGTPLTAKEYAWTFQRALNPETLSPVAGTALRGVTGVEAADDFTLRFSLAMPNYPLLENLTTSFFQPLSPAYVEAKGKDYGRNPMGVGPFRFKAWATGEKIVLERNPDFTWGPSYTHGAPSYIETIEYRFIPENATVVAGLETGEIDLAGVETQDLAHVQELSQYQIVESPYQGSGVILHVNNAEAPLDDVRVRQALNLAVDRDSLIKIILRGHGAPSYGPLQPAVNGYWPGVEYIGYGFDLARAMALMADAGFAPNANGILEKDGAPLQLRLAVAGDSVQAAEVLQQMFKDLGVEITIEQYELGAMINQALSGDYDLMLLAHVWPDSSLLFGLFHSSLIGVLNYSFVNDPQLNPLLEGVVFSTSDEANLKAAADAQRRIVEQANIVFLYAPISYSALSNKVKGVIASPVTGRTEFFDAYIETTTP